MPEPAAGSIALVVADEPLRAELVAAARHRGYEPRAASTPLEAVHALVHGGERIAYAILASAPGWALSLRELIADEFPQVGRLMLVA